MDLVEQQNQAHTEPQNYNYDPILFKKGNVEVNTDFIRIGSSTYPVANISALDLLKKKSPVGIGTFLFGGFLIFLGCVLSSSVAVLAIISILIGILCCLGVIIALIVKNYILEFQTSGGKIQVLGSTNIKFLNEIKESIEKAIIIRHRIR